MSKRPSLLTCDNFTRHLKTKTGKLQSLIRSLEIVSDNEQIIESTISSVVSYFEAALIDTIKEFVYSDPKIFVENSVNNLLKKKHAKFKYEDIEEIGYETYFIEGYLQDVAFLSNADKVRELKKISSVDIDLGTPIWEKIIECVARRNCFIHNDLIANGTYFKQAGNKAIEVSAGSKIPVDIKYLKEQVSNISSLFDQIIQSIEEKYREHTNVAAVKRLWDYLFENDYPFEFEDCWDYSGKHVRYIGPSTDDIKDSNSPRVLCLFSIWKTFFNSYSMPNVLAFSSIFCHGFPYEERKVYSEKIKYLMDCFEKIEFQSFGVQMYEKQ